MRRTTFALSFLENSRAWLPPPLFLNKQKSPPSPVKLFDFINFKAKCWLRALPGPFKKTPQWRFEIHTPRHKRGAWILDGSGVWLMLQSDVNKLPPMPQASSPTHPASRHHSKSCLIIQHVPRTFTSPGTIQCLLGCKLCCVLVWVNLAFKCNTEKQEQVS